MRKKQTTDLYTDGREIYREDHVWENGWCKILIEVIVVASGCWGKGDGIFCFWALIRTCQFLNKEHVLL